MCDVLMATVKAFEYERLVADMGPPGIHISLHLLSTSSYREETLASKYHQRPQICRSRFGATSPRRVSGASRKPSAAILRMGNSDTPSESSPSSPSRRVRQYSSMSQRFGTDHHSFG